MMQPGQVLKPQVPPAHDSSGANYHPEPTAKPPQYEVPPPPPKQRFSRKFSSIFSTLALIIIAPLIAISIAAFVVQSYQVDGQSMETTLQNSDRLIVDKWPRTWARITNHHYIPARGDIIIFNQSGLDFSGDSKQLIKRVVALPGEKVEVKDGKVTVYNNEHPSGFNPDEAGIYKIDAKNTPSEFNATTLNSDEIFVLGDNRTNSEDSRYFGPVKVDKIVGKLSFRIVPLNKAQRF